MTKTVKELINNALNKGKKLSGYELQEILEKNENELAKKDKEHKEQFEIKQLYKEDFKIMEVPVESEGYRNFLIKVIVLKDNSKYDKLPSKEEKENK